MKRWYHRKAIWVSERDLDCAWRRYKVVKGPEDITLTPGCHDAMFLQNGLPMSKTSLLILCCLVLVSAGLDDGGMYILYIVSIIVRRRNTYYHGRQMIYHCFLSSPMFHCILLHKLADNRNNILLFVCAFFSLSLDIVQLRKKECLRT